MCEYDLDVERGYDNLKAYKELLLIKGKEHFGIANNTRVTMYNGWMMSITKIQYKQREIDEMKETVRRGKKTKLAPIVAQKR